MKDQDEVSSNTQVRFYCTFCYSTLEALDELRNKECQCPHCNRRLMVPNPSLRAYCNVGGWRIDRLLGAGGMGEGYEVSRDGDRRAIKIIRSDKISEREIQYFKDEIAMTMSLNHPNIVKALEAGQEDGVHYLVSELVEGRSLDFELQKRTRLSSEEVIRIALSVAKAMAHCWNKGNLIHRDIKPGNIIRSVHNLIKVADLGLGIKTKQLMEESSGAGTRNYMSPETLARPREVSYKSDIYSLGVTMFELISGTLPYCGGSRKAVYKSILADKQKQLSDEMPNINWAVNDCVKNLMEKNIELRPGSWDETISLLEKTLSELQSPRQDHNYVYSLQTDKVFFWKQLSYLIGGIVLITLIFTIYLLMQLTRFY